MLVKDNRAVKNGYERVYTMKISVIIPIHNLGYASDYCLKGSLRSGVPEKFKGEQRRFM